MEDASDFEEDRPADGSLPDSVKRAMQEVKEMRERQMKERPWDTDAPDLFIGKFIRDRSITCEVVSCTEDDFRIMILKIEWDRLGTYLNVGQTYPLRKVYQSHNGEMTVWEVTPENMKRSTSQVLLTWEKGIGWSWDLDM